MTHNRLHQFCRRGLSAVVVALVAAVGPWSAQTRGGDWPQFRGPGRDNKLVGFTAPANWPKELKKDWSVSVGDSVASPALVGDKLYTFTRRGGDEVIACIDAGTGKELWTEKYPAEEIKGGAGGYKGPRGSPAVSDDKVCTFGVTGVLTCLDAKTGKQVWRHETKGRPTFYTSVSPTIADGKVILYTGSSGAFGGKGGGKGGKGGGPAGPPGKGELVAYDLATGDVKWKLAGEGPGYGSPVVVTLAGVKQVVVISESNLVGAALADGKQLWKTEFNQGRHQTGTPVIDGDTVILAGSAYKIEKKGDEFVATRQWRDQAPHQYNTPVLKDGIVYGYAGQGRSTRIYAQDAKTGKPYWADGAAGGECGSILDAGTVLIALSSDGNLIVFKGGKDDYTEVAKYMVADGGTWAAPVIDGKRIFVKDRDALTLWTIE